MLFLAAYGIEPENMKMGAVPTKKSRTGQPNPQISGSGKRNDDVVHSV